MANTWEDSIKFEDERRKFINDVKKRPVLWDHISGSPSEIYKARNEKWEEMADIYGGPDLKPKDREVLSQKLQKRWRNLKDYYVRFFKSTLDEPHPVAKSEKQELLSFLDDSIRRKMSFDEEKRKSYMGRKEEDDDNFQKGNVVERDTSTRRTRKKRYREDNASESHVTGDEPSNNNLDDSTDHLKIKDTFSLADQMGPNPYKNPSTIWDQMQNKMKFEDEKLNFLTDIKKRPAIWEHIPKNCSSVKLKERFEQWEEMVDIYGGPDLKPEDRYMFRQEIQKKWRNLKDNYMKFFKSSLIKPGAGQTSEYHELLSFLNDSIRRKMGLDVEKRKSNMGQKEEGDDNFEKGNVDERDTSTRQTRKKRYREDNASESDVTSDYTSNNRVDDSTDHLKIKDTFSLADQNELELTDAENDECDVFGNLVSVKLRKLDQNIRCQVQSMIYQTLFNAEMARNNDRVHIKK